MIESCDAIRQAYADYFRQFAWDHFCTFTAKQTGDDDLVKGAVWSVNDGMPQKLIEYTIGKEVEVGTIKADNKPTYESVVDKSIVDEAIKRNGGPWTGDPRWY